METPLYPDTKDQEEIERALKRATWKKALYFYDSCGAKHLLGVFNQSNVQRIRTLLEGRGLIDRISEAEVLTDHPDSQFSFSMIDKASNRWRRNPRSRNL